MVTRHHQRREMLARSVAEPIALGALTWRLARHVVGGWHALVEPYRCEPWAHASSDEIG